MLFAYISISGTFDNKDHFEQSVLHQEARNAIRHRVFDGVFVINDKIKESLYEDPRTSLVTTS